MKSRPAVSGIFLASGLLAAALLAGCAAQEPPPEPEPAAELVEPPAAAPVTSAVMRVAEFEHLTTPRVDLSNEADGESPLRRACPESSGELPGVLGVYGELDAQYHPAPPPSGSC